MSHPGSISIRIAAAIAILVFVPAWNSSLHSGASRVKQPATNVPDVPNSSNTANKTIASNRLASNYGKLPISFEVNQGQTDSSVQFLARGAGYTLFLTPGEAVLSLHATAADETKSGAVVGPHRLPSSSAGKAAPATPPSTVRLQLIGANIAAKAEGLDPLPGKSNYFIGTDPAKWHTDVSTYAKVRYSNVYPGIDLLYYGNQEGKLEHDFVVAPGADPNLIAIALGDSAISAPDKNGALTVLTGNGDLTLQSPTVYQDIDGQRKAIPATYLLANNQIKFQLGRYDRTASLIIDPVLRYSAVFGGTKLDSSEAIAVDGSGNAYVSGHTESTNFPLVEPIDGTSSGLAIFVSKINSAGTSLLYSTYLAGVDGSGIAVDNGGRAYVTGFTQGGIPTKNAYQPAFGGGTADAFLTVLGPGGDSMVYSTYLGGKDVDFGTAIAVDASGNAYITGTSGVGFPTLHSIFPQGVIFTAKFDQTGALRYSSVLATNAAGNTTDAEGIAVDSSGSAYITGSTYVNTFPITKNAFQSTCIPCPNAGNAFVSKFAPTGDSLAYSTYLGATSGNYGRAIAVDTSGNAYIGGQTGPGLRVTQNAFQKTFEGGTYGDGFVSKLNSSGTGLVWSTYLGGSGDDWVTALALDQHRQVYVTGRTYSGDFPLKAPIQAYAGGGLTQGFVTTLSGSLDSIVYYSTYLGTGDSNGWGWHIALDTALNVYVTGATFGEIQSTFGALRTGTTANPGGQGDAFVSKLVIMDDLALGLSASSGSVAQGGNLTYTIAVTSKGPDFGSNVRIDDPLPSGTTFVSYNAGIGTCTVPAVGATGTLHCALPQLNKGQTYTATLTVKVNAPSGTTLSNTATTTSNMQDFVPSNNKGTLTTKVN